MGFKQTLGQFFTSKTNWAGMVTIVGASIALYNGSINLTEFSGFVSPALLAMGVKDAI